jgi:5-methylcytosine-specific restriction protein B
MSSGADSDTGGLATVSLNRRLLAGLRSCPIIDGWSTKELERLVYMTERNPFKKTGATRMVKIAPGEDAKWWDDCLANGYICVGWDDVGDLGQYETVHRLRAALETTYYEANKGVAAQKAQLA